MAPLETLVVYGFGPSPNPWKVYYILEELGLPYREEPVEGSELKKEPFISLNPNGRLPALKDPNTNIVLWESGAIIDYLIDTYDTKALLHYETGPEKHVTRCWEHFQMSGQGPYFGQKSWFERYHPEKVPSAIDRYRNEMKRVAGVVDAHLIKQGTEYLVGDKLVYADIMFFPWFQLLQFLAPELDLSEFKHYKAWLEKIATRPAVAKVWAKQHEACLAFMGPGAQAQSAPSSE